MDSWYLDVFVALKLKHVMGTGISVPSKGLKIAHCQSWEIEETVFQDCTCGWSGNITETLNASCDLWHTIAWGLNLWLSRIPKALTMSCGRLESGNYKKI